MCSAPPSRKVHRRGPPLCSSSPTTVTQCQSSRPGTPPPWRLSQATGQSASREERRKAAHWSTVGRASRNRGTSRVRSGRDTPRSAAKAESPLVKRWRVLTPFFPGVTWDHMASIRATTSPFSQLPEG